ncbi:MAG: peptidase T [Spirochaetales bacterium]|nr:peptidase T [Spirochaetales bacterium]
MNQNNFKDILLQRFLKYVKINTQSDPSSDTSPSTDVQFDLASVLEEECSDLSLSEVFLSDKCYLTAKLPANCKKSIPPIGFLAHLDTSPDISGENVKPRIIEKYNGKDILLNVKSKSVLSPLMASELLSYTGQTLITTDGTTLLGADDKAGIAEILTAIEYLIQHPEIKHGDIYLAFTPDEEIGRGVQYLDTKRFCPKYAYTIDGTGCDLFEYECFNAANATISIQGLNVHPGHAKNKMKNALLIMLELIGMFPAAERPEHTEDYEGFYHFNEIYGNPEKTSVDMIIRDHHHKKFIARKNFVKTAVAFINQKYGSSTAKLKMKDMYYNMRDQIEKDIKVVNLAINAYEACGIEARVIPIRGGTDGAVLSYRGIPCPNIFTGGHNAHGRFEYVSLDSMEKSVRVILKIIELFTMEKD